jgi:hypothetical protein
MQAITERFGPSHLALLGVMTVSDFFTDIANAFVLKFFSAAYYLQVKLTEGSVRFLGRARQWDVRPKGRCNQFPMNRDMAMRARRYALRESL